MFGLGNRSIKLGHILGISIEIDYSWFLIFVVFTWLLAVGFYPAEVRNWPTWEYWVLGAVTAIMLFVSVLLHELGHSVVAMRYKIPVPSITLFIFGGVSQIAAEPPTASAEFWIAVAGPIVSFVLAGIFAVIAPVFTSILPLLVLLKYLAYINALLGLFNLIPGFPLDGGRVFRAVVWGTTHNVRRATVIAGNVGRFFGFLFILFGVWQVFTGNFINGLWIGFVGWFLESAAGAQIQQQRLHSLLAGHKVSEVMSRNFTAIDPQTTLQQVVDEHILGSSTRSLIVQHNDTVAGLLTLHHVKEVSRDAWSTTTAAEAMIPLDAVKRTQPDAELWDALEEMDRDGVNQLPAMTDSHIEGMLTREDVISYLRSLHELED